MSFIWPWMLLSLLAMPFAFGFYVRLMSRRRATAPDLSSLTLVRVGTRRAIGKRRHLPAACYGVGLTLLLFGLSRPEMVISLPRVEGTVILAFDVSNSMSADDLEPTRIEAAKTAARTFAENQPSTVEIGVVAFSNGGLVVQQPTDDRAAVLSTIERLSPQGGTSLAQGIFTSLNAIAGEPISLEATALEESRQPVQIGDFSSAVILLLTDGENTGPPDPLEVAQVAADAGVRIYPVGIGTQEGTVLNIDGFNILTQLDEAALQQIASLTNGSYYIASDEESLLDIYQNIDLRLTMDGEETEITSIVAGLSALSLLIGGGLAMLWFGRLP